MTSKFLEALQSALYCPRCGTLLDAEKGTCVRCGYIAGITKRDVERKERAMHYANSPSRDEMTWMASEAWVAGCKLADELSAMIDCCRDEFVNFELVLTRLRQVKHERNEAWAALEAKERDYRAVLAENERLTRERDEARAELTHARDGFDKALSMNEKMRAALKGSK